MVEEFQVYMFLFSNVSLAELGRGGGGGGDQRRETNDNETTTGGDVGQAFAYL